MGSGGCARRGRRGEWAAGVGEERVLYGEEQGVQCDLAVVSYPVSELFGEREDKVLVGDVEDFGERGFDPSVDGGLAAGGAEAGFAGVRNASGGAVASTAVFGLSPAGSAKEHPGDVPDDGPAEQEDIFRPEQEPCAMA